MNLFKVSVRRSDDPAGKDHTYYDTYDNAIAAIDRTWSKERYYRRGAGFVTYILLPDLTLVATVIIEPLGSSHECPKTF